MAPVLPTSTTDGQRGREAALTVVNISKTFGATRALVNVGFSVPRGSIHGLVGGNGSGKSTLIKILAGVYRGNPGGAVEVGTQRVSADETSPEWARRSGLRFVHQNPGLIDSMSVAENIALGGRGYPVRGIAIRWSLVRRRAADILDHFELDVHPDDLVGTLRPALRTMVAIARALQDTVGDETEAGLAVLVLDEPTASLADHEVAELFQALRQLAERGHTIILVSHRLGEVLSLVEALTLLRDGQHVVTRGTGDMTEAQLAEYIVGRPLEAVYATQTQEEVEQPQHAEGTVLEVTNLVGGPLIGVSFAVRRGEILGIAGLVGSGRTELLRMVFGADRIAGGTIRVDGVPLTRHSPAEAMARGVAYISEDRERDSAFAGLTVLDNLSIATIDSYWSGIALRRRQERTDADDLIASYGIRTAGHGATFASLSGGNQQKVVLARWLRRKPTIMLLDEPTQGVDVGSRADLYAAVRHAVSDGAAAVLVASDLEELAHACDRALVLRDGRIVAEVSSPTAHELTELAVGDRNRHRA